MKFLIVDSSILHNTDLSSGEKLILAYISYVESYGKGAWGGLDHLSQQLGMAVSTAGGLLTQLSGHGIIIEERKVLHLNLSLENIRVWHKKTDASPEPSQDIGHPFMLSSDPVQLAFKKGDELLEQDGERFFFRSKLLNCNYVVFKKMEKS